MKIFEIGYMENKKGIIQIIKDNRILENNESLNDLDINKNGEIRLNCLIRPDLL